MSSKITIEAGCSDIFIKHECNLVSKDEIGKIIAASDAKDIDGKIIRFTSGKTEKIDWKEVINITGSQYLQSKIKMICLVDNISGVFEAKTKLGISSIAFAHFKPKSVSYFFSDDEVDQLGENISLDSETLIGNLFAGGELMENVVMVLPFNNEDEKREFKKHFNFSRPYNITGFLMNIPKKIKGTTVIDKIIIVSEYSLHVEDFSPIKKNNTINKFRCALVACLGLR
jgi:hypothetical protein